MGEVREERVQQVKEWIRSSEDYTFERLLLERGVLDGFEKSGSEFKGCCLLHPERNPSASFNDSLGIWNCFSCGQGGDYVKLVSLLNPTNRGYFNTMEQLLRNDKRMQLALGFSSIFQLVTDTKELKSLEKRHFKPKQLGSAVSYLDLAERLVRRGANLEEAKMAILLMQQGMPITEVSRILLDGTSVTESHVFDLGEVVVDADN